MTLTFFVDATGTTEIYTQGAMASSISRAGASPSKEGTQRQRSGAPAGEGEGADKATEDAAAESSRKAAVASSNPSCGNSVTSPVRVTSRPVMLDDATIASGMGSNRGPD